MIEIKIKDKFGSVLVTSDHDEQLYQDIKINLALDNPHVYLLNFEGVTVVTPRFFSWLIGRLFLRYNPKWIDEHVQTIGLDETYSKILEMTKEKAIQFYSASEEVQRKLLAFNPFEE